MEKGESSVKIRPVKIDQILMAVQDTSSRLELMGISNDKLWIAGGVALLLFIISLREVLSWFLRVQQVRDEVRGLRKQMNEMQTMLADTRELLQQSGAVKRAPEPLKAEELLTIAQKQIAVGEEKSTREALKKFRLDH
jgi:hypothetical protein